jgi:hypothetical protein
MQVLEEEVQDAVTFQRSTPDESTEEDRSALLPHYGCSPFMDIDVRDRKVLPSTQLEIKRCALVEFVNIPLRIVSGSDENDAPGVAVSGNRARGLSGVEGNASYVQRTKSARACAAEMIFAYRHNNPWGFQVFEVLTGKEDAFEMFRSVLPRRMDAGQMYEHLQSLDGLLSGPAETVRLQLISACVEFSEFAHETITASVQERTDRHAGGKGKARYDKRDEKLANALGEKLPEINPTPVVHMPAQPVQQPVDLTPLVDIIREQQADARRRDEKFEELQRQIAGLQVKKPGRPARVSE